MDAETADIFSSIITAPIERIEEAAITDEQYQAHCLKVYERIRLINEAKHSPMNAEAESLATPVAEKTATQVPTGAPTSPEAEDVESTIEVEIDSKMLIVPVVSRNSHKKWKQYLSAKEVTARKKIKELLTMLEETENTNVNKMFDEWQVVAGSTRIDSKTRSELDIVEKYIIVSLAEHWITERSRRIAEIAEELAYERPISDAGLWLEAKTERSRKFLDRVATKTVPQDEAKALSSRDVRHLTTILFSRDPTARAVAKLDLKANLRLTVYRDVMSAPEDYLERAMAGAGLTSEEVLAIVFAQDEKERTHKCMSCGGRVVIGSTFYHSACKTIAWIEKHTHYKRDATTGAVKRVKRGYIDPDTQSRLSETLKLYYDTNKDIVIKTAEKTVIWRRQADFSLKNIPITSRKDDELVGSQTWLRRNGFSE